MNAERRPRTIWIVGGGALAVVAIAVVAIVLATGGEDESESDAPAPAETTVEELTVDDLPAGAIAYVEDVPEGTVTEDDLEARFERAALTAGLRRPPAEGDPDFERLREGALTDAIVAIWIRGEAEERGIAFADEEVRENVEQIVRESFGGEREFENFVVEQGLCSELELRAVPAVECERVLAESELQLLAEAIQEEVTGEIPPEDAEALEEASGEFEAEFTEKWRGRTVCAEELVTEQCSNGPEPDPDADAAAPGAAPVTPASPEGPVSP